MTIQRRVRSIAVVLGLAALLTACSTAPQQPGTGSTTPTDALQTLIDEGLKIVQSDFQRDVLKKAAETGQISEADWKESNNKFVDCMKENGIETEVVYNGAEVQFGAPIDPDQKESDKQERQQTSQECGLKTNAYINEVYAYINQSPHAGDGDGAQRKVLACLIDRKLVPADSTFEQFVNDLEQNDGKQFGAQAGEEYAACWKENT